MYVFGDVAIETKRTYINPRQVSDDFLFICLDDTTTLWVCIIIPTLAIINNWRGLCVATWPIIVQELNHSEFIDRWPEGCYHSPQITQQCRLIGFWLMQQDCLIGVITRYKALKGGYFISLQTNRKFVIHINM